MIIDFRSIVFTSLLYRTRFYLTHPNFHLLVHYLLYYSSYRPPPPPETGNLQTGHVEACLSSQVSMHFLWKAWLHGNLLRVSSVVNSSIQIQQSLQSPVESRLIRCKSFSVILDSGNAWTVPQSAFSGSWPGPNRLSCVRRKRKRRPIFSVYNPTSAPMMMVYH